MAVVLFKKCKHQNAERQSLKIVTKNKISQASEIILNGGRQQTIDHHTYTRKVHLFL